MTTYRNIDIFEVTDGDTGIKFDQNTVTLGRLTTWANYLLEEDSHSFDNNGGDFRITNGFDFTRTDMGTQITPRANQALVAANPVVVSGSTIIQVSGSGGAVTLTSTPTIADRPNGTFVTIIGTDDTNTLTLQDEGNLAGSNLELSGGVNFTFGLGDTMQLMFHTATAAWIEISRSDN